MPATGSSATGSGGLRVPRRPGRHRRWPAARWHGLHESHALPPVHVVYLASPRTARSRPPPPCGRTLPGALCGLVACPAPLGARTSRVRPPEVPCACGTCRCPCVSNQAGRARRARARARATARARARVRVRVRARARGTAGLGSGRGRGLGRWVRARVRVPLDSEGRTGTFKIRVARGQNRDLGQPKGSERDGDAVPARFY